MSLQWFLNREVPEDTANIGRAILRSENVYRQIGERFNELFPEEREFAPLYFDSGRGAMPPLLMALVTVFQMLEKVPDRLAADYVVSRMDWKYALHLPLTYSGFHFTDLSAFRQRLVEHEKERWFFDQFLLRLQALGLLKARGKMRTDSTHVLGVVQRLSVLELVSETLQVALKAVLRLAPHWVQATLPPAFVETVSQRRSEYGLSEMQVQQRVSEVSRDAFWFLAQVDTTAPPELRSMAEVAVLRTVLAQQFPQGPGTPPRAKRPMGKEVLESPHEPEARYGIKRGTPWLGYKMQVTETCDADLPHLLVDVVVTGALDNDAPELRPIQQRLHARNVLPAEQQVDQGYMRGANLVQSAQRGIDLLGLPLADTQGPVGFRQSDFQIDAAAKAAHCPAGETSRVWSERHAAGEVPPYIEIRFDRPTCQACPCFGRCTTSPQGRSLTLHPYREVLNARRLEAQSPEFRARLHLRAGIEGTLSELVRGHGARCARYRGRVKLGLQQYFTGVAVNLKRVIRWWTQPHVPAAAPAAG